MKVGDLVSTQDWTVHPKELGLVVGYNGPNVIKVFIKGTFNDFLDDDLEIVSHAK